MEYLLLAVFIVALIALYLGSNLKKEGNGFEQLISFFLVFIAFHALYVFIFIVFKFPEYVDSAFPFGLVYGPVFYFALKTSSGGNLSFNRFFVHLIPFFIGVVCFFIFAFGPNFRASNSSLYYGTLYFSISISMIGYVASAFFSRKSRPHSDSFNKTVRLITVGFVILATLGLLLLTLTFTQIIPRTTASREFPRILIYTAMLIQVAAVLRYQIDQLGKNLIIDLSPEIGEEEGNTPLYQKSLIAESAMDLYEERLDKLVKDKIFQNVDLSLEGLAKQIGAPKHHLTQLLNIRMKKTFNQYINGLRVDYACEVLSENESSIEEIAYDCGFNSKASFNRNFKTITGYTPSEYRSRSKKSISN